MRPVAHAIDERTPQGIAAGIARLITSGELAPGDRLPTVRDLAAQLGVSPATVSAAWRTLAAAGLVSGRGRSGTTVRQAPQNWLPNRYRSLRGAQTAALDLSRGTPDPALLPRLGRILRLVGEAVDESASVPTSYQREPDIPELHDLLKDRWAAPVETLTVVDGALDGVDRVLPVATRFSDRLVVPEATFPPFLDLAEQYGLDTMPVATDGDGMLPAALAAALNASPAVVLLQPRADNPTGTSMSADRAAELADVLRRSRPGARTIVVEDDHSAEISAAEPVSIGRHLPARVVRVTSFSKSHGPDLRIGAVGGPRALIDRIVARRLLGPAWTSRTIQTVLWRMLTDPESVEEVARARAAYASRQRAFAAAMAAEGMPVPVADGLNAWIPVADERSAIVRLAAAGIRVAPGQPFQLGGAPRIRVTVGLIDGDPAPVAAALVAAARA